MSEWQPIETAPRNGTTVRLGWIVNRHVEFQVNSRWLSDRWDGDWTPTHWRLLPEPPANSVEDEMIGQPKIETGVPDKEVIRRLVRQKARLVLDLDNRNRRIATLEAQLSAMQALQRYDWKPYGMVPETNGRWVMLPVFAPSPQQATVSEDSPGEQP